MTAPRIATPEEAQDALERWRAGLTAQVFLLGVDFAHTVVVQAEQIAAVLALCDQQDRMHATVSTDRVRRALGVTA